MEFFGLTSFFFVFVRFWQQLLSVLDAIRFDLFGYDVSFLSVIFAFLVIGMVVTIFWKGART